MNIHSKIAFMDKRALWVKIAVYHFDHLVPTHLWDVIAAQFGGQNPFTKAFADKLSRKLNWDKEFAMKAIWEYKKFVYLGVISDFSVTPSKIIDQVWHEHLLFSFGYRKFCEEVIQYSFDHNPELVPVRSQTEAFKKQYFYTIDLYEREFGSQPPADIWDTTKFRESKAERKIRHMMEQYESSTAGVGDTLISLSPGTDSNDFEFGGGEFGGAGASGSWFDSSSDSEGDSDGGTSCSSSCGGGGCGGD